VGGGYAPSAIPHALVVAGNDSVALRGASRLTQIGERWLGKVHLPTGNLAIEDMVRLVIQELSAEPREDWEALVAQHTQA
jgi:hypothetical protein